MTSEVDYLNIGHELVLYKHTTTFTNSVPVNPIVVPNIIGKVYFAIVTTTTQGTCCNDVFVMDESAYIAHGNNVLTQQQAGYKMIQTGDSLSLNVTSGNVTTWTISYYSDKEN